MNTLNITRCVLYVIYEDNEHVKNCVLGECLYKVVPFVPFKHHFLANSLCTYIKKLLKKGLQTVQTVQTQKRGSNKSKTANLVRGLSNELC